ncbi:MOP flippase family protein [candidate division KSB1 bacterium]|nr:MOP flippase family protein [candidate division KSB1 bacterium]
MATLKEKTVSGVFWTGLAKTSMQFMLVAVLFILARLLSEEDFGLIAMAGIITVAIGMVNERGLGTAIIQKKSVPASQLSTMFWASLVFGGILFGIGVGISFPFAKFYNEQLVKPVIIVMSTGFFIGAFGIVQKALLTKEMAFKKLAIIEMCAVLVSGITAIILAMSNFGVWSLVALSLLRDLISVILLWLFCPWRPVLHFSRRELNELLGFSASVLGNDVALYLVTNADITIIGKVLGKALLGYYSLALNLVKMPVTRLSAIVARVVFPAFSELQDDLLSFKKSYLRSVTFISLITFPLLAGLAVFSREFIQVFLGENWLPMSTPLMILIPMAMLKSVGSIKGSVLMACGKPEIEFKWNLAYLLPLIAAVLFGTRFGLTGAAAAFTILYIFTFPVIQQITNKQINVTMKEFGKSLKVSTFSTAMMAFVGIVVKLIFKNVFSINDLWVLITGVILSVLTYYFALRLLNKTLLNEFLNLFKNLKKKQPKVELQLSEVTLNS